MTPIDTTSPPGAAAVAPDPSSASSTPSPTPEPEPSGKKPSPWRERISALKNVPPVLEILWESGPSVVTWGILLRVVVAVVPALIGYVSSRIISYAEAAIQHRPIPSWFWYLVALEVFLAIFANSLNRIIDYLDSLLADRYTLADNMHQSVQGSPTATPTTSASASCARPRPSI